jgi:sulfur-oxidizing protein SoxZ
MAAPMRRPRIAMSSRSLERVVEFRTRLSHSMEGGHRRDASRSPVPRDIIRLLTVSFGYAEVSHAKGHITMSANPCLAVVFGAQRSGSFTVARTNDAGTMIPPTARLRIG